MQTKEKTKAMKRLEVGKAVRKLMLNAGGRQLGYDESAQLAILSPKATWKAEDRPNKFMNLAKTKINK